MFTTLPPGNAKQVRRKPWCKVHAEFWWCLLVVDAMVSNWKRDPACLVFRVYVKDCIAYPVMWWLFHRPWNKDPYEPTSTRWWQLKYFLCSPRTLGKMNPILTCAYFSDGLVKNHQPEYLYLESNQVFLCCFSCGSVLSVKKVDPGRHQQPQQKVTTQKALESKFQF